MNEGARRLVALRDPDLPAMPAMLGPEAAAMLAPAAAAAGGSVESVRVAQVTWKPGHSLTVLYEARLRIAGSLVAEALVAHTGQGIPAGAAIIEGKCGLRVTAWTVRDDPALPALRTVLDPAGARALLDTVEAPRGPVQPRLRAYRPGRRAVVELVGPGVRLFAKLVRPHRIADLQRLHRHFADALPVPPSLGWSAEHGIVLLGALPGETLREALARADVALPGVAEVLGLLDAVPPPPDGRRAPSLAHAATAHAGLLSRIVPEAANRIAAIIEQVHEDAEGPLAPCHGDYYESQVMVAGGRVAGLLDIDTAGLGERTDDYANLLAHLSAWAPMAPDPARVRAYGREVIAVADRMAPPAVIRRRVAAALVGLATGPFRVQSPAWPAETLGRLAHAERWLESARKVA